MSQRTNRSIRPFENIFEMYPKYGIKEGPDVNIVKEVNESKDKAKEAAGK